MGLINWIKGLFKKEPDGLVMEIPEGVDISDWCHEQIIMKCIETGKHCHGSWENGKFTIHVID